MRKLILTFITVLFIGTIITPLLKLKLLPTQQQINMVIMYLSHINLRVQ